MTWAELGSSKYLLLTTFRKDGSPVSVPLWAAPDGDRIVVWTDANSWKVKRIRRNPEVRLQACNLRGTTTTGPESAGRAEIQDAAGTERTRRAVGAKYGLTGRLLVGFSARFRGRSATIGIAITPA